MPKPGTKVTGRHPTTRALDGVQVTQTVISWNDTDDISVDYCAGDIDMYADPHALTSFDAPLSDEELRDLLATYGVRGFKLTASDPNTVVADMLDAAAGALSEHDTEAIALVTVMLDAVLDEDAKAARPAIDIVRAEIAAI